VERRTISPSALRRVHDGIGEIVCHVEIRSDRIVTDAEIGSYVTINGDSSAIGRARQAQGQLAIPAVSMVRMDQ
jgi:hypothetical protein